jgi:PiT family inorganic phosphate transporter
MFYVVFCLALLLEFVNGWTDAPNSIATVVSTRVLRPLPAVCMAAVLNLVGALITGTAVAEVIGKNIVDPAVITLPAIAAALLGASLWSMTAQRFGIPTSESHGLVAGLIGAGVASGGFHVVVGKGTNRVLFGLVTSPVLGFTLGLLVMLLIYRLFRRVRLGVVRGIFGRAQILSAAFMALSHGSNDGQKTMGVLTLTLFLGGRQKDLKIPIWVILLAATVMGIGTASGGWRVVRTLGVRMTHLEPVNGFAAETAAAGVILAASRLGIPVSTTHVIGSSIMGVGATKRLSAVRWGVAGDIVMAWILTWPGCGLLAYGLAQIFLRVAN